MTGTVLKTYTAILTRVYPKYCYNPNAEVQVLEMHDECLIVHVKAYHQEHAAQRVLTHSPKLPWKLQALFEGELSDLSGFSKVMKL